MFVKQRSKYIIRAPFKGRRMENAILDIYSGSISIWWNSFAKSIVIEYSHFASLSRILRFEFSIIHYYSTLHFYFWIRLSGSPLNYIMSFTCRRASARLLSFSATVCGNKWLWHCYCRFLIFIVLENILFF